MHLIKCRVFCLWLGFLLLSSGLRAQNGNQLNLIFDYGIFRYDSTRALVEFYYSIPSGALEYVPSGETLAAEVTFHLTITRDGADWKSEAWRMQKQVSSTENIQPEDRMLDTMSFQMGPGEYHVQISAEDSNHPKNHTEVAKDISVSLPAAGKPWLSSIQLANSIKRIAADSRNVFYKNGLEVVPNPENLFGKGAPILYYYVESYNLNRSMTENTYKTRCAVTDTKGRQVDTIRPRLQVKNALPASVEVSALNVSSLPSGPYVLHFEILDARERLMQTVEKKFFIYNPDSNTPSAHAGRSFESALLMSEFATMAAKQLNREIKQTRYIADKQEFSNSKKLGNPEAKKRFLFEFWKKRDPTPETPFNEYREEYKRRIAEADKQFRSFSRAGWRTDRGRVFILYGNPSDIERFPNNAMSYSYQIWHYDGIEGGVIFVFADLQEFGEFTQLHSTKRGEPKNEDWERIIEKN